MPRPHVYSKRAPPILFFPFFFLVRFLIAYKRRLSLAPFPVFFLFLYFTPTTNALYQWLDFLFISLLPYFLPRHPVPFRGCSILKVLPFSPFLSLFLSSLFILKLPVISRSLLKMTVMILGSVSTLASYYSSTISSPLSFLSSSLPFLDFCQLLDKINSACYFFILNTDIFISYISI